MAGGIELSSDEAGRAPSGAPVSTPSDDAFCSIERTVGIVGDRWVLLILRQVLAGGMTRFTDLVKSLGVAPNILTNRLEMLTRSGVLERREYREPGSRPRMSYHPTAAGRELLVVLAALGQWGDDHIPPVGGVGQTRETTRDGEPVRVGFVTDAALLLPAEEISFVYTEVGRDRIRAAAAEAEGRPQGQGRP
ncbi:winged helix-turn-helix transcriptional regulator [Micromonospora sp. NPDC050397]|uniref:winged helix-turn-helix transcriptional regulator n=1 Tax=Micromonospora sp. NPDC050397 TaxID=3364279 RepID=UPI00384CC729